MVDEEVEALVVEERGEGNLLHRIATWRGPQEFHDCLHVLLCLALCPITCPIMLFWWLVGCLKMCFGEETVNKCFCIEEDPEPWSCPCCP
mmetsp:Transcript_11223/g.25590  ORF Transcript_11223/g.25590 Transcript_11223/m.25590 type:complete len:90 (+) Transcript_11223:75-344(+)